MATMAKSLPSIAGSDLDDESSVRARGEEPESMEETRQRELSFEERVDVAFAMMDPPAAAPAAPAPPPNRSPTRQSLEAVKLAEWVGTQLLTDPTLR